MEAPSFEEKKRTRYASKSAVKKIDWAECFVLNSPFVDGGFWDAKRGKTAASEIPEVVEGRQSKTIHKLRPVSLLPISMHIAQKQRMLYDRQTMD